MAGPSVVVFLNSGRCGTAWLTHALADLYRELDVEHEPIGPLYAPRRYFRRYDDPEALLEVPEVAAHVERIERSTRPYAETGWPLFPVLPLLAERLGDRLRVVHLTRHPVPSALAHLARRHYAGSPRNDPYTRLATLGPEDPGVFQPFYAQSWDRLSPYEKCLFWWAEVHQFALGFPGRIQGIPILRVKAEELAAGRARALARLLEFMELPAHPRWNLHLDRASARWDRFPRERVDALEIHRHPVTTSIAVQLGYDVSTLNAGELDERFVAS